MTGKYSKYTGWCSANGPIQSQSSRRIGKDLLGCFCMEYIGFSLVDTDRLKLAEYIYRIVHTKHALFKKLKLVK